jgi:Family of unknown function (DUF6263)
MTRMLLIVVVAAACGGSPKPPPTAPLPDDSKQASAPPAQPDAKPPEPVAPKPPPPAEPVEVKLPALQTTVKIVTGGKGKKQAIRYSAKAGAKQAVEFAMDFAGRQDTDEQVVPTIVLTGEAETKAVDKDGNAEYTVTVTGTDAREVTGSAVPLERFKAVLGSLSGLTIGGKLGTTGVSSDLTLRLEHPPDHAADALDLIRLTLPTLPVLPKEAVGVGAKWQSTTTMKLADRLDVTQITDYEVVAHNGPTWKIKGTTKVSGKDQNIEDAKISAISGSGTSETTIADGTLYPTHKSLLETQFKAADKDKSTQFVIKVGGAVTPK